MESIGIIIKELGSIKEAIRKAKENGIDVVNVLNQEIQREELYKLIEVKILELNEGKAKLIFPYSPKILRRGNIVNGGIILAVMDLAIGLAVMSVNHGIDQLTTELKVNFLEPLKNGPFSCIAKVIRIGRTLAIGEAEIYDNDNKLCAKGIGTWYIVK